MKATQAKRNAFTTPLPNKFSSTKTRETAFPHTILFAHKTKLSSCRLRKSHRHRHSSSRTKPEKQRASLWRFAFVDMEHRRSRPNNAKLGQNHKPYLALWGSTMHALARLNIGLNTNGNRVSTTNLISNYSRNLRDYSVTSHSQWATTDATEDYNAALPKSRPTR